MATEDTNIRMIELAIDAINHPPIDYFIKKDDRLPTFQAKVFYSRTKAAYDLTNSTIAITAVADIDGTLTEITGSGTALTPKTEGKFNFEWGATDTAVAGEYNMTIQITESSKVFTLPNNGYIKLHVDENL